MLTIFRRHGTGCPHTSRRYRRCQCAIWIEGSIGDEKVHRRSLNLTSWEAAEDYVRESNRTGKLGGTTFRNVAITEAVELYLADVRARVRASTVRLHRVLLQDQLLRWCESKGFRYLKQLDVKALIEFRAGWTCAPMTALKKFERLRSFFRFCEDAGWILKSPASGFLAPPRIFFSRMYARGIARCGVQRPRGDSCFRNRQSERRPDRVAGDPLMMGGELRGLRIAGPRGQQRHRGCDREAPARLKAQQCSGPPKPSRLAFQPTYSRRR